MKIIEFIIRHHPIWVTFGYLGLLAGVFWKYTSAGASLSLNELGDFLAGAFAPLAFYWLVLGFFQQGKELKNNVNALNLQAEELKNSVAAQTEIAESARLQINLEESLENERRSRKLTADRAELGLALHELYQIFLSATRQAVYPKGDYTLQWEVIYSRCRVLASCIENADPESAESLAKIVRKAQYITARHRKLLESPEILASSSEDQVTINSVLLSRSDAVVDLMALTLEISNGFQYARMQQEKFITELITTERLVSVLEIRINFGISKSPIWEDILEAAKKLSP
ncbi:hypothetical protein GFB49_15570 [Epibacterium sp. SM1979]|uniref:Uncharacterized protein n=1 Tax=Tritonibacter litoralis TaxID=2662264 RepID=A0A843YKF6_9RHOB|nr:hypothetical protein [Tritonibacter litoralis]MQQ09884.1 hypothetical protein [Tritonibacter litoralis]